MLEKKVFAMSMFVSTNALFKAKADYYYDQAEKLEMERVVLTEQLAQLERDLYQTCKTHDETIERLGRTIDQLERGES